MENTFLFCNISFAFFFSAFKTGLGEMHSSKIFSKILKAFITSEIFPASPSIVVIASEIGFNNFRDPFNFSQNTSDNTVFLTLWWRSLAVWLSLIAIARSVCLLLIRLCMHWTVEQHLQYKYKLYNHTNVKYDLWRKSTGTVGTSSNWKCVSLDS